MDDDEGTGTIDEAILTALLKGNLFTNICPY